MTVANKTTTKDGLPSKTYEFSAQQAVIKISNRVSEEAKYPKNK